jgi:hypothetical protein
MLAVPGGIVFLGYFLYQYLTGNSSGFPYVHGTWDTSAPLIEFFRGFQPTLRANLLAQKIVKAGIEQGHNSTISFYTPDNCKLS